jgi:hypothetical protein
MYRISVAFNINLTIIESVQQALKPYSKLLTSGYKTAFPSIHEYYDQASTF